MKFLPLKIKIIERGSDIINYALVDYENKHWYSGHNVQISLFSNMRKFCGHTTYEKRGFIFAFNFVNSYPIGSVKDRKTLFDAIDRLMKNNKCSWEPLEITKENKFKTIKI